MTRHVPPPVPAYVKPHDYTYAHFGASPLLHWREADLPGALHGKRRAAAIRLLDDAVALFVAHHRAAHHAPASGEADGMWHFQRMHGAERREGVTVTPAGTFRFWVLESRSTQERSHRFNPDFDAAAHQIMGKALATRGGAALRDLHMPGKPQEFTSALEELIAEILFGEE